jgi:hypothetical protein
MTQEEKQLLLKDLSARLPYEIKGKLFLFGSDKHTREINIIGYTKLKGKLFERIFAEDELDYNIEWFKPYLRPMSSMTEEERIEYRQKQTNYEFGYFDTYDSIDWLNAHHFDYRGLIEKGFALEAPNNMYNT